MSLRKPTVWLIVLGVVSYLVFLIATLPAAQVFGLAGERLPLRAYGVGGSLWDGHAAAVSYGPIRADAVRWDLAPGQLLLGRLGAEVQARLPGDGRLAGELLLTPGGLRARPLKLDMPLNDLLSLAGMNRLPVKVDGRLDALLQRLNLTDGQLTEADGLINWNGAVVRFGNRPLPLGEVALRLTPAEDGITGELVNQNSPLKLDGDLKITPDGKFTLAIEARAAGEMTDDTRQALGFLGVPADGSPVKARLSGALDGSGFRMEPLNR